MHIFIDESGSFVPSSDGRSSMCCVATLAVSESRLEAVEALHARLIENWNPPGGEIKGARLTERQCDRLIVALGSMGVLLGIVAIDMSLHSAAGIGRHRDGQAERIRASVEGPEYFQSLRDETNVWADRVGALPAQLYVESTLLSLALAHTVQMASLHFAQADPPALGAFKWRIDAKDRNLTEYERLWLDIIKPIMQSISMSEPVVTVNEFDYSAMRVFQNPVRDSAPEHLSRGIPPERRSGPFHSFDARKLVADVAFEDSRSAAGLQLVDVLANVFRRACNGRLRERGWRNLGRLMVKNFRTRRAIQCVMLTDAGQARPLTRMAYWPVLHHIDRQAPSWELAGASSRGR